MLARGCLKARRGMFIARNVFPTGSEARAARIRPPR
jgi:hypothetical protein